MLLDTYKDLSIKRKLMAIILATSAISLLLAGSAFLAHEVLQSRHDLQREFSITADILAENSATALIFQDNKAAADILRALNTDTRIIAAAIYDRSGNVFASVGRVIRVPNAGGPKTGGSEEAALARSAVVEFKAGEIHLLHPIILGTTVLGALQLRASTDELTVKATRYLMISGAVLLSSLLIAFFISSGLQRVISNPILELAKIATGVSADNNYSLRAKKHGNDEVGKLIEAFNGMLAQIDSRETDLRRHRDHLEEEVAGRTSDLRQLNGELTVAKERAEAVARLKSEFLANMSQRDPDSHEWGHGNDRTGARNRSDTRTA
jgi:nitrogen fixation/metabolism regulation signal transduction histidine kinase